MKLNKLFMGFLGALALTACSSEDVVTPNGSEEFVKGDTHYMAVTIRNANPEGTRAAGDQSGDLFEEGLSPENEVNSIRLYFFDKDGNGRAVKADGTNYMSLSAETLLDENGNMVTDMPNIEKVLTAVIAIDTREGDNVESLKSVVAVVNGPADLPGNGTDGKKLVNLSELREIIGNYGLATATSDGRYVPNKYNKDSNDFPGFLMTSATYGSDDFTCEVEIKPTDLYTTTDDAFASPVKIYVERVVAKVRMTLNWDDTMKTEPIIYNGVTYTGIALTDKEGKAYTTADGKQIYALFTGWGLQSTANMSYMFKKVDSDWTTLNWNWSDALNHRSYWAMNPAQDLLGNKFALQNFKHSEATKGKFGTKKQSGSGNSRVDYNGDFFYCQENASDVQNTNDAEYGLKKYFDPDSQLTNRTQAYIGALLVTEKDGEYAPIELAEWGGKTTDISNVVISMLSVVNDQIFTRVKIKDEERVEIDTETQQEITVTYPVYEYYSITPDDIELVEEEIINTGALDKENGKRYLTRIQLKKDVKEGDNKKQYYNASHKEISYDDVNAILLTAGKAKVWGGGTTYYYVDLQHIAKTGKAKGADGQIVDSKYGVVRNHIYDVYIQTVYGLGTPILKPVTDQEDGEEKIIIPEHPGDDDTFLGVQLYILSWRVVDNSTSLDW